MQAVNVQPKLQRAVEVIPVDANGLPVLDQRCQGTTLLVKDDRVLLSLQSPPEQPALVVAVQTCVGATRYVGIHVRNAARLHTGQFLIQGQVGGLADALLQPKNLTPRFHFDSMTFTFGFSAPVLHRWEEAGVLQSVVIDRLLLCPRCHGLPTFRHGCRRCGSGRVSLVTSLRNGDGRDADPPLLVFGDPAPGDSPVQLPYHCLDCHGSDTELVPVNQCLHCDHRFTAHEGYGMVLRGYRVWRLDEAAAANST